MNDKHDKLSKRIVLILIKLNNAEKLTIKELADEFNVSTRTIRRDFDRLNSLPIKIEEGKYSLDENTLGKLTFKDLKNFALVSGIRSLYPSLSDDFILDILNNKINKAFLIKNHGFEDISERSDDFKKLKESILNTTQISFFYNNKKRIVKPYKLVNNSGVWYLVADEDQKLKTYTFKKIKLLTVLSLKYEINKEFKTIIDKNEIDWFSQDEMKVTLEIDNSVIEYFSRKNILPNQKIIDKTVTKTIVSTKVSYENEILNIVKYWIPNVRILEPTFLSERLNEILINYLGGDITCH